MTAKTIAVDLGGTHVRAALVAEDGVIEQQVREQTPVDNSDPAFLVALISQMNPNGEAERAVIGVPGVVDHEAEKLVRAPNLPSRWQSFLTDAWLTEQTRLKVSLANDADLAAVGEAAFGAGRDYRDVVYMTISTGVGAGIVVDRSLVRGRNSGGEIGHTVIDRQAEASGLPSTVEELGSGSAIARMADAAGLQAEGAEFVELVTAGDKTACDIWSQAMTAASIGVVNMAWIVAPQIVVIGGGVGMNGDLVLSPIRDFLSQSGPVVEVPIKVVNAALGDDAALIGAAAWWAALGREL